MQLGVQSSPVHRHFHPWSLPVIAKKFHLITSRSVSSQFQATPVNSQRYGLLPVSSSQSWEVASIPSHSFSLFKRNMSIPKCFTLFQEVLSEYSAISVNSWQFQSVPTILSQLHEPISSFQLIPSDSGQFPGLYLASGNHSQFQSVLWSLGSIFRSFHQDGAFVFCSRIRVQSSTAIVRILLRINALKYESVCITIRIFRYIFFSNANIHEY